MVLQLFFPPLLTVILFVHGVTAFPQVDFERMGNVGLAGAFAGLDVFQNSSVSFDSTTSTLLSRSSDGFLTRVASTNSGGSILAGCTLGDTFYLAGSFNSIDGVPATNVASYTLSSSSFASLGSNSPNGEISALFCDSTRHQVWVGGSFSSPGGSIALYDPSSNSWSSPPFGGVSGLQAKVTSITTNSSDLSLFFTGSFLTSFGNGDAILNGTNNPNVPFSIGASPFSSALVPIPLGNAQVDGSPSSTTTGFSNINNTLCPAGPDGSGNSWFASDSSTPLITIRTFSFISASGIRLGNTFQANHGTTGFTVTTIPDNNVRTLKYLDPATGQNQTCTDPCPLSTDPTILYQDFLFDEPLDVTGVQIQISEFTGSSAGLHILQLLSSGAFASSIDANNGQSCYAPNASNSTETGQWTAKVANTNIAGTVQTVLVSTVSVGTPASSGPSFTWFPYVSASGDYDVNLLVPGCTDFQDCSLRTSVQVTVFPGAGSAPFVTTISQQNQEDATTLIYSGPIFPSSPNFVTTISMTLADNPAGSGQNGQYELVADRVQLVLNSANVTSSGSSNGNVTALGLTRGVGFLEWPRSFPSTSATAGILPNSTLTTSDFLGFDILSGIGGIDSIDGISPTLFSINAVAHHNSGIIFVGGAFSLTSGSAAGTSNLVSFKNGGLVSLANDGLNGQVTSLVLVGDQLYVGGSFQDTSSGSTQNKLGGIALYNVRTNSWSPLDSGVNGAVSSIGLSNNQIQIAGNFTELTSVTGNGSGINAPGFGVWDIKAGAWINSGGFVVGNMTFIGNETSSTQLLAGNVVTSQKYGATGLVMLKNGNSSGPAIRPLSVNLDASQVSTSSNLRRRAYIPGAAWISHMTLSRIFSRQVNQPASPPPPLPASAPAVLAGAFWSNSSNELTILGGNFSFVASGTSTTSTAVAIYNPGSTSFQGLAGSQVNGTVRALLVDGNSLYVGGEFTIPGATVNGFALYDLSNQEWDLNGLQSLQPNPGSTVTVRSISHSTSIPTTLIVAGSFSQAGSLHCQAICSFDTVTKQWNTLGSGIQGDVTSVVYAGTNQGTLIAAGSILLSDNTPANVVQYTFNNATWTSVGVGSDIPGPISAIEVNSGNASSLFAAGTSSDGSSSFLSFWNGIKWAMLGSTLEEGTTVAQLTMVPLQDTHGANSIIESDRVLMISGSLTTPAGNASSALFDGQNIIPYIVSSSSTGTPGSVSSLFHSLSSFSFDQQHFLATGVVILISIAIGAGFVFFLALVGILWTLFSRKDEKLNKLDGTNEDDDDSTNHRPSSLLEHINAATRTTILGAGVHTQNTEKGEEATRDADPFGPDASNYVRAETPSDAVGGMLAEETSRPAHARYSFDGAGEGELPISAGAEVEVLDDRDPAWWYARDVRTGQEGVVPAAYLY